MSARECSIYCRPSCDCACHRSLVPAASPCRGKDDGCIFCRGEGCGHCRLDSPPAPAPADAQGEALDLNALMREGKELAKELERRMRPMTSRGCNCAQVCMHCDALAEARGREAERRDVVAWLASLIAGTTGEERNVFYRDVHMDNSHERIQAGQRSALLAALRRIERGKHRPTPGAAKGDGHGE